MTDYCTKEFKAMENIFEGMLNVNYFNIASLLRLKDRLSDVFESVHSLRHLLLCLR